MLPQDKTLELFSLLFCLAMALMILVPYARGKSDLLSFCNIFLGGSILFIGLSGYAWSSEEHRGQYAPQVYTLYYLGFSIFYTCLILSYTFVKFPRKFAARYFRAWPKPSFATYFSLALFAIVLSVFTLFKLPIPFVGEILFQLTINLGPMAVVMALMALSKDKFNPLNMLLVTFTVGVALVISLSLGGGRRPMMTLLLSFPVVVYWTWLRYKKPRVVLPWLLVFGMILLGFNNGLYAIRHHRSQRGGVGLALDRIKTIATETFSFQISSIADLAQDSSEVTLYTIHLFVGPNAKYEGELFFGPKFILVNPIPRSMWPDKPQSLGYRLPNYYGKKEGLRGYGTVTWGISPVAQGFYDGGLLVIAIYGFVGGLALRYFDELVKRQPNNPFLLAFMTASSGHLLGIARGSMDTFIISLISCGISLIFLSIIGKLVFGSEYVYPKTDHLLDFPRDYLAPNKQA